MGIGHAQRQIIQPSLQPGCLLPSTSLTSCLLQMVQWWN